MNSSKGGALEASWFRGIVLSLSLHAIIFLLAIFWGFSSPKQSGETQSIEGRLVSPSELEQSLKEEIGPGKKEENVIAPQRAKTEIPEEPKKVEVKEEPPKIKVERPKKAELKKEEPPPKIEEEKPKDVIALETKKKKQVAEIPKPTEQPRVPPKEVEKPRKPSFEDVRNKVLEDMRKVQKEDKEKERQRVLSEIEKKKVIREIEEGRIAEANPSNEERGIGGGGSGSLNRQSPGARAALAALFINRVREEIKNSWGIPENIPRDGSLRTVVVFRIDGGGRVHDVRVEKSSGNPAFDDFCVKAIYRASPLTPPPSELLEEAKTDGVEVPFTNDRS